MLPRAADSCSFPLQARVIGTLLGEENDGVVEIKNCFPVPHTEIAEEVQLFARCRPANPAPHEPRLLAGPLALARESPSHPLGTFYHGSLPGWGGVPTTLTLSPSLSLSPQVDGETQYQVAVDMEFHR